MYKQQIFILLHKSQAETLKLLQYAYIYRSMKTSEVNVSLRDARVLTMIYVVVAHQSQQMKKMSTVCERL
jgi:hypothetical protein